MSQDFLNTTALVTGASRGIGASIVRQLAERGANVAINYRSKKPRAEAVAEAVQALGRRAILSQADITVKEDVVRMYTEVEEAFGRLDVLILNASGGLEKNKAPDYAMQLNCTAQERLLDLALPLMPQSSRVVFVTSHWAHFYGTQPVHESYEAVAVSKRAGETALRTRIPSLAEKGISLVVVSGDVIEGTITPKLLERQNRGLIEARRQEVGHIPTVDEFARAIVDAVINKDLRSGETVYVGSTAA